MTRPTRKAQNFTLEDDNNPILSRDMGMFTPAESNTRASDNLSPF